MKNKRKTEDQILEERDNLFLEQINKRLINVQKEIKTIQSSIEQAQKIILSSREKQLRLEGSLLVLKEIKVNLEQKDAT